VRSLSSFKINWNAGRATLGLFGFGASAHLVIQIAKYNIQIPRSLSSRGRKEILPAAWPKRKEPIGWGQPENYPGKAGLRH